MRGAKRARAQVAKSGKRPVPYALCRRCQQAWKREEAVRCTLRQCSEAMDIVRQAMDLHRQLKGILRQISSENIEHDDVTNVLHNALACGPMWLKPYRNEMPPTSLTEFAKVIPIRRGRGAGPKP